MNPENEAELEIARRIADGESVDLAELGQGNPDLARRLGKLQSLAHAMQGSSTSGSRWTFASNCGSRRSTASRSKLSSAS